MIKSDHNFTHVITGMMQTDFNHKPIKHLWNGPLIQHCSDDIMSTMASQITSLMIVCSTFYSNTNQRKHQSSASLAFVWGIHRSPVNSPHKGPVMQKMFPFDDIIMQAAGEWYNPINVNQAIGYSYIWQGTNPDILGLNLTTRTFQGSVTWTSGTSSIFQGSNTLRPRRNGSNFPDDILKCIFLNESVWISIKISLKLFLRVQLTISQHWLK